MTTPHHDDSGSVSSPPEPRYYIINQRGLATLCADLQDAIASAAEANEMWPPVARAIVAANYHDMAAVQVAEMEAA